MVSEWINFVTELDPNGKHSQCRSRSEKWPLYKTEDGHGEVALDGPFVETDDYREEAIEWLSENPLEVFGN